MKFLNISKQKLTKQKAIMQEAKIFFFFSLLIGCLIDFTFSGFLSLLELFVFNVDLYIGTIHPLLNYNKNKK